MKTRLGALHPRHLRHQDRKVVVFEEVSSEAVPEGAAARRLLGTSFPDRGPDGALSRGRVQVMSADKPGFSIGVSTSRPRTTLYCSSNRIRVLGLCFPDLMVNSGGLLSCRCKWL